MANPHADPSAQGSSASRLLSFLLALLMHVGLGTLLFVGHADIDPEEARARGFDPEDYLSIDDLEAALQRSSRWEIAVRERRPRHVEGGAGGGHTHDEILKAVRSAD